MHVLQRRSETALGPWKRGLEGIPQGIQCKGSVPYASALGAWARRSMASAVVRFPSLQVLGPVTLGSSSRLPGRPWAWIAGKPVFHTLDPPGGYQPPIRNLSSSGKGQPKPDDEVSIHLPGVPSGTLVKRTGFPDPGSKDLPGAQPGYRGNPRTHLRGNPEISARRPIDAAFR